MDLSLSASDALLDGFAASSRDIWLPGIHFLSESLRTALIAIDHLIAIDQLPRTDETLWLRLLGKGETQQQAILEVLNFPTDDSHRVRILELFGKSAWKSPGCLSRRSKA